MVKTCTWASINCQESVACGQYLHTRLQLIVKRVWLVVKTCTWASINCQESVACGQDLHTGLQLIVKRVWLVVNTCTRGFN